MRGHPGVGVHAARHRADLRNSWAEARHSNARAMQPFVQPSAGSCVQPIARMRRKSFAPAVTHTCASRRERRLRERHGGTSRTIASATVAPAGTPLAESVGAVFGCRNRQMEFSYAPDQAFRGRCHRGSRPRRAPRRPRRVGRDCSVAMQIDAASTSKKRATASRVSCGRSHRAERWRAGGNEARDLLGHDLHGKSWRRTMGHGSGRGCA